MTALALGGGTGPGEFCFAREGTSV
jgi:hypothetical protein